MEQLTKREMFGALAMQELIHQYPSKKPSDIATMSFMYADFMLTESAKNVTTQESSEPKRVVNQL